MNKKHGLLRFSTAERRSLSGGVEAFVLPFTLHAEAQYPRFFEANVRRRLADDSLEIEFPAQQVHPNLDVFRAAALDYYFAAVSSTPVSSQQVPVRFGREYPIEWTADTGHGDGEMRLGSNTEVDCDLYVVGHHVENGIIAGATVDANGALDLKGVCIGDITVLAGAVCRVYGSVNGSLFCVGGVTEILGTTERVFVEAGEVVIRGVVRTLVAEGGEISIQVGAVIRDQVVATEIRIG